MWLLTNINNEENIYYLICGPSLNVSRDGTGHIILRDKTVSKAHATFNLTYVDKYLNCPEKRPEVILCDLKSTNGTYLKSGSIDFVKLSPNEPVILKHGDLVKFGRNITFRLEYEPLIVTSSQITSKQVKEKLKECIKCLGAHLVKEWISNCSLLVMNDLMLTAKTVCALAAGAHIVTPEFLIDMISSVKENGPLPDFKKYLPVLKEPSINSTEVSFFPAPPRKKVFSGKTFYFQNESSHKKMKGPVIEAGGSTFILSEINYKDVIGENSILIKSIEKDATNLPKFIISCFELLKSNGLHPIPESDIGLAVVYCSTEKYCNPKFRINLLQHTDQSQLSQKLVVYATETQNETEDLPSVPFSRTTVPESGESSKSKSSSSFKKPCLPNNNNSIERNIVMEKDNTSKRKRLLNESISPDTKREEPKEKKRNEESILADTQEMTVDVEMDDGIYFIPKHCSTEKISQNTTVLNEKVDEFVKPETSSVRRNVRISENLSTNQESFDNSFTKSIPFDPYTLPSINVENFPAVEPTVMDEEVETQPFLDLTEIKQEPKSQSLSQAVRESEPRIKEKITNIKDDWIGGTSTKPQKSSPDKNKIELKNKIEPVQMEFAKPETQSLKKENEFALPCSTVRKRRNRTESSESNAEATTSKRTKLEEHSNNNEFKVQEPVNIKRSPSELSTEKQKVHNQVDEKNLPFISKNYGVKNESRDNEISELGQTLERSLVVVEVVSLIRKVGKKTNGNVSFSGLANFKKFKKILPYNASFEDEVEPILPRIIGGHDLVFQSDVSSRRESFIATQPDLQEHLEARETVLNERNTSDDKFDTDFGFSVGVKSRRKGRL